MQPKEDGRLLRGEQTRERVLDAAERLFADHGFDAVSIRQIAMEAEVTLGVVGFHSGSKEQLFETILKRRVDVLSKSRMDRLAGLQGGGAVTLRDLMSAYIEPYLDMASTDGPQCLAYARLIANVAGDARWYPQIRNLFDPPARAYIAEIMAMFPHADRQRVASAFVMAVAAMLSTQASAIRMASLGDPEVGAGEPAAVGDDLRETLITFCAAGIERAIRESGKAG